MCHNLSRTEHVAPAARAACRVVVVVLSVGLANVARATEQVDYFVDDSLCGTLARDHQPRPVYFAGQHKRTYVTYMDHDFNACVVAYDHDTRQWIGPARVDDCRTRDGHNAPAILITRDGMIHLFYGCHNHPVKYARSAKPEDISAWQTGQEIGSKATYTYGVQTNAGELLLFYRYGGAGRRSPLRVHHSTDGGKTWDTGKVILDYGGQSWVKIRDTLYDPKSDRVHLGLWELSRKGWWNVHHVLYDPGQRRLEAMNGTPLGPATTKQALIEAGCRVAGKDDQRFNFDMALCEAGPCFFVHENWKRKDYRFVAWDPGKKTWRLSRPPVDRFEGLRSFELHPDGNGRFRLLGIRITDPPTPFTGGDLVVWTSADGGTTWDGGKTLVDRRKLGHGLVALNLCESYAGSGPFIIIQEHWRADSKKLPRHLGSIYDDAPWRFNKRLYALDAEYRFIKRPRWRPVVEAEAAFWRRDLAGKIAWKEGNPALSAKTGSGYPLGGSLHVLVRNHTDHPIKIEDVLLNGQPARALREKRTVVWWRVQPNPVPSRGMAEVTARLRTPVQQPTRVELMVKGGPTLQVDIATKPLPFRIETIGMGPGVDHMTVYVTRQTDDPVEIKRIEIDGVNAGELARFLAPRFFQGTCPIVLRLPPAWTTGSFHAVKVVDATGRSTGHVFRVPPRYTPLGTYGHHNFDTYAANDLNTYVCFGGLSRASLDRLARLHMRGAFHIGFADPSEDVRGHPAIAGYLQRDEPDCADYGVKDRPHHERIGHHAQQMVEHALRLYELDPKTVLWQTLDLTYKPANWFHYGLVADVTNTDAYPLVIGAPLTFVRDVVQTARSSCAPRPLVFTFQSGWEEAKGRGWNRPPFADEMRRMMLYAIGSGARGLVSYIHCSEKVGSWMGHGTNEFPDLWYEQGRMYRSLSLIDELLQIAHPLRIESTRPDGLWVATLLAGPEAMIVVVVNDNYTSKADVFEQTPVKSVRLQVPRPRWLVPKQCARVDDGRVQPITMAVADGQIEVAIDQVEAGELFLISQDPSLPERLLKEFERRQTRLATVLLGDRREALRREAARSADARYLPFRYRPYKVEGRAINGYGISRADLWNPSREKHNGLEYWQGKGASRMGVSWTFDVPTERGGKRHTFLWMGRIWGTGKAAGRMTLRNEAGKALAAVAVPLSPTALHRRALPALAAGKYTIELVQKHDGEKGGRIAKAAFVVPVSP